MSFKSRLGVSLLSVGLAAPLAGELVELEVHPAEPTSFEQLAVGVSGVASCVALEEPTLDLEARTVTLVMHLGCVILPPAPAPFQLWRVVGSLDPGIWEVRIEGPAGDLLTSRELRVRHPDFSFELLPERPTPADEVVARLRGVGSCAWPEPALVEGRTVFVTVFEVGLCDPPPPWGPFEFDLSLGQFDEGVWELRYLYAGYYETELVATGAFEVLPVGSCASDSASLCLQKGRFRVEAEWRVPDEASGRGRARPLTEDSGLFWFFREENLELLVKVLDGCGLFGHYWVYASGVTDLEVELTVTDTLSGAEWSYTSGPGVPFEPVLDSRAFATCP